MISQNVLKVTLARKDIQKLVFFTSLTRNANLVTHVFTDMLTIIILCLQNQDKVKDSVSRIRFAELIVHAYKNKLGNINI